MRIKECGGVGIQLWNGLVGRERNLRFPSLHGNAAVLCVDAGHHAFRSYAGRKLRGKRGIDFALSGEKRGTDNDATGACIDHLARALDGANSAAGLDRETLCELGNKGGVVALAHGCIEIDQLDKRILRELFNPIFKVVESKAKLLALHQLDDASAQQIYGRNQHGSLTETPARASSCLSERALDTPKWKMLAARAASALPRPKTSTK